MSIQWCNLYNVIHKIDNNKQCLCPNKCYELLPLMFMVHENNKKTFPHTHTHTYARIFMHTKFIAHCKREKKGHSNQQFRFAFKKFTFYFLVIKLNRPSKWSPRHIIIQWESVCVYLYIYSQCVYFCIERILWILFYHCLMLSMSCNAYKSHNFESIPGQNASKDNKRTQTIGIWHGRI